MYIDPVLSNMMSEINYAAHVSLMAPIAIFAGVVLVFATFLMFGARS